jgi:hypothetical protein
MKKLLCLLSLFIYVVSASAQQTYTITGIVTDDKDAPIPGATVFIADSRLAAATDAEGRFALKQVWAGKHNLVVKMMGYVVTTHEFTLQNEDLRFRLKLSEDNLLLNAVNISGISRVDRESYLETFMRCFFGTSAYARDCKIKNADIIKFHYNKETDVLTAGTDDFLIIENKALGYRIKYLLTNFSYDKGNVGGITSFAGKLFYEDMPGNEREQKEWREARADVYLGSITHFFRALFNSKANEDKFVIYQVPNQLLLNAYAKKHKQPPQRYYKPVKSLNKFITGIDDRFKAFDIRPLIKDSTELLVLYTPKREPKDFGGRGTVIGRTFKMPLGQLSFLRPVRDSIIINKNGDVSPATNLIKGGFWTWGQMATFIPSDYELPTDLEIAKMKRRRRKDTEIINNTTE